MAAMETVPAGQSGKIDTKTDSPCWWDIPLVGDCAIPRDRSRFLRIHACPQLVAGENALGTVVVIHGGYWKNRYGLDDEFGNAGTASLAPFFLQRGFGAIELEYRRRDHEGGGWPGTNEDVLAALRQIGKLRMDAEATAVVGDGAEAADTRDMIHPGCQAAMAALRPDRLIIVGHSAGGCLALWAAHNLMLGVEEGGCAVKVAAVLAAAPVCDLVRGYNMKISDEGDAVELYMKCIPEGNASLSLYNEASPSSLLPVTFPLLIVYGDKDVDVPPNLCADYAEAARASAPELVRVERILGADHFDVVNAESEAWKSCISVALGDLFGRHIDSQAAKSLLS
eukprot:TRINITY_DN69531_c0_g1_i1.p1 TRINITY_DN69531_c0_g1~~TRINITY_DN69531_c0_g1_i1.p1  ORF type:complete len:357 (+),score=55.91 TRINITY_DN69531_c0_g1_i1:56-1072(+)